MSCALIHKKSNNLCIPWTQKGDLPFGWCYVAVFTLSLITCKHAYTIGLVIHHEKKDLCENKQDYIMIFTDLRQEILNKNIKYGTNNRFWTDLDMTRKNEQITCRHNFNSVTLWYKYDRNTITLSEHSFPRWEVKNCKRRGLSGRFQISSFSSFRLKFEKKC